LLTEFTAPYAASIKQQFVQLFYGAAPGNVRQPEIGEDGFNQQASKVSFLLTEFTAPYATSKKLPIFSGCFFEVASGKNERAVWQKRVASG